MSTNSRQDLIKEYNRRQAVKELENRTALYRESFYEYVKYIFPIITREKFQDNRHIKEICEGLECAFYGTIRDIMICVPPRSLKTFLVCKLWTTRCVGNNPRRISMAISVSDELITNSCLEAREIYESTAYKTIFPKAPRIRKDLNQKGHWKNEHGGGMYASGITGTITGMGCHAIILDDPLKAPEARSPVKRELARHIASDTIRTRFNVPSEGITILIMQRLHEDDVVGRFLYKEKEGNYVRRTKFIYPAIVNGESFFPERFPLSYLEEQKREMNTGFYAQYMQDPVDPKSREFFEKDFRYYEDSQIINIPGQVIMTIDPAFREHQDADYAVIMTCKVINEKVYIIEYVRKRFTMDTFTKEVVQQFLKHTPSKIGIEGIGAQDWIIQTIENVFKINGLYHTELIKRINQSNSKGEKIRALIPFISKGQILRKDDMVELETELLTFPNGRTDDVIDALQMVYYLITLTTPLRERGPTKRFMGYNEDGYPIYQ